MRNILVILSVDFVYEKVLRGSAYPIVDYWVLIERVVDRLFVFIFGSDKRLISF